MDPRRRIWIYAGLSVVAGVGLVIASKPKRPALPQPPGPQQPPPAKLGPSTRALLLGDSFAVGLATPLAQVVRSLGGEFVSDGRVGTTISQWAKQPWAAVALQTRPNLVFVSLGTNDMRMLDPSVERAALAALVDQIRATGARVVWIDPPSVPFPERGVRAMLAAQPGIEHFPSAGLQIPRGPDNLHPTAAGYAGWAGAIARWVGLLAAA